SLGVPVVEKPEQEMFGADPSAFKTPSLLNRSFERSFGGHSKGNLVDRLGGGAKTAQHSLQVVRHGAPLDAEPIQPRERNPVTLLQHREEKMFWIHRAMMAPVRLFVRCPNDAARGLREALKHTRPFSSSSRSLAARTTCIARPIIAVQPIVIWFSSSAASRRMTNSLTQPGETEACRSWPRWSSTVIQSPDRHAVAPSVGS